MHPTPPSSTPALPGAPAPITTAQLHDWLERRRKTRGRIKAVLATLLAIGAGGFAVTWTFFHHQFIAMGSLRAVGFTVEWSIDAGNFTRGGTTLVAYRQVRWSGNEAKPGDLDPLRSLNHLETLDLGGLRTFRDEELAFISELPELVELQLDRTPHPYNYDVGHVKLTDKVIDHLKGLRRLKTLGLADNRITDAGLAGLANLSELESLDLDGTLVSDHGLESLKGLKKLRYLRLVNTAVTPQGVADFQRALPTVEVTRVNVPLSELAQ